MTNHSPAEGLRQAICKNHGFEPWELDEDMKLIAAYAATVEREAAILCDVCKTKVATRRGLWKQSKGPGFDFEVTFGLFCDTCVAYPNLGALAPEGFRLAALQGPQDQTDDGIDLWWR